MANFEILKKRVGEEGTDKMKEVVEIAGLYLKDLNEVFFERDISKEVLVKEHYTVFFRGLQIEDSLKGGSLEEFRLLTLNVLAVARHTWNLVDKNDRTKTGDDLREAYSPMFTGEKILNDEELYAELQRLCGEESSVTAQISKGRWPEWPREVKSGV